MTKTVLDCILEVAEKYRNSEHKHLVYEKLKKEISWIVGNHVEYEDAIKRLCEKLDY